MEKYKRIAYILLAAFGTILAVCLFLKYVLRVILPFILAFVVVSMIRPLIDKICRKTKAPKSFVTIFTISILTVITLALLIFIFSAMVEQIGSIFESIVEGLSKETNYVAKIFDFVSRIEAKIPFIKSITNESMYTLVTEMITDGVKSLSMSLTSYVARVVAELPQIMVTIIVVLLSLYYFAKDYEKIGKRIVSALPSGIGKRAPQIKNDIILVVSKYVKSYLLLILITFAQLFAGFLILGIENSFVLSVVISFVDILPVLGVGTVLVPWAIILLIGGQTKLAIGLLVMFIIIYVVRQYLEPRIVSAQMEVHPLITLFAMYAGLKLAGILGLVFAPLVAFVVKTVYKSYKNEKTVDIQE